MTTPETPARMVEAALAERFGAAFSVDAALPGVDELARIASHRTHRRYSGRAVEPALLRLLIACALSAPSKSDLQQADIVHVADRAKVKAVADGIPDMPWIADAPVFLVFLANNRRIRQIGEWRGKPFANNHLDSFLNAAVDSALAMQTFILAAEAVGLGCCPISVVRNHVDRVAEILELPKWVFPVAGLCVGWPAQRGYISMRLPPALTVHVDRYDDTRLAEEVEAYDRRRDARFSIPPDKQRRVNAYGVARFYGWSEDKARQVSVTERDGFGPFVRRQGIGLD